MSKEELKPTNPVEPQKEIPEQFVPLVPSEETATVVMEFGPISWVPAQMPRGLSIDIAYLDSVLKQLKIEGKIHLENLHDDSDQGMSVASSRGDTATASRAFATTQAKKSESKYDSENQVHRIGLNISYLKRLAGDSKNQSENMARFMSIELKKALCELVLADIQRMTKEEFNLCANTLAVALFVGLVAGNFAVESGKFLGIRSNEITPQEALMFVLSFYVILRTMLGMFEVIVKESIGDQVFRDEMLSFFTKLGFEEDKMSRNQMIFLATVYTILSGVKQSVLVPGFSNVPRRGRTFQFNHSRRPMIRKS